MHHAQFNSKKRAATLHDVVDAKIATENAY
jgi:hypothetical protein